MPEQPNPPAEFKGGLVFNGKHINLYKEKSQLPRNPQKTEMCEEHINGTEGVALVNAFWEAGCRFPENNEDSSITVQFACRGLGIFTNRCRLRLRQLDDEGNIITEGKLA